MGEYSTNIKQNNEVLPKTNVRNNEMEENRTQYIYKQQQTGGHNTKPICTQRNGPDTRQIQNGETLFSDGANLEYTSLRAISPKIKTYGKTTSEYDLKINWGKVEIITNHNVGETKTIIIIPFGKHYNQIGGANRGTILGRLFACTSSKKRCD